MKKIIGIVLIALVSGYAGSYLFHTLNQEELQQNGLVPISLTDSNEEASNQALFANDRGLTANMTEDFTLASSKSTKSVVYIKNINIFHPLTRLAGKAIRKKKSCSIGKDIEKRMRLSFRNGV